MEELPKQLEAPKKKGIRIRFGHYSHQLGYGMKEVFIGKRTAFSILGFIVGGLVVGRSVWEYLMRYFSLPVVILIGFLIFIVSGIDCVIFSELRTQNSGHRTQNSELSRYSVF